MYQPDVVRKPFSEYFQNTGKAQLCHFFNLNLHLNRIPKPTMEFRSDDRRPETNSSKPKILQIFRANLSITSFKNTRDHHIPYRNTDSLNK